MRIKLKCRRKFSHAPHIATCLLRDGRDKENSLRLPNVRAARARTTFQVKQHF